MYSLGLLVLSPVLYVIANTKITFAPAPRPKELESNDHKVDPNDPEEIKKALARSERNNANLTALFIFALIMWITAK